MKMICDVTDEVIKSVRMGTWCGSSVAEKMIANGIPLPKGHGRLIDADVFEKRLMDARSYYIGEKADDFDLRFAAGLKSAAERLVDAPTIIEADTEAVLDEIRAEIDSHCSENRDRNDGLYIAMKIIDKYR